MTTEVISYNSINDTDIESELIEDKEDFFVEVAKIINESKGIRKVYDFQQKLIKLSSDLTHLTSDINRLHKAELDQTYFQYKDEKSSIDHIVSITQGKNYIKKKVSLKLDVFLNYLADFRNENLDLKISKLKEIFNNLKEEYLIRDFSKKVIYSDAEIQLNISNDELKNYISDLELIMQENRKKNEKNSFLTLEFPSSVSEYTRNWGIPLSYRVKGLYYGGFFAAFFWLIYFKFFNKPHNKAIK